MINYIKNLFCFDNKKEDDITQIINYYNKRLIAEMKERQDFEADVFDKMYKYRNKLIEHGIFDFDE